MGRGKGRSNGGMGKGNSVSGGARGFGFARMGVVELDEVLLNPACGFDELGQCGSGPAVKELRRDRGGELVAKFGDGGTDVFITARLDI